MDLQSLYAQQTANIAKGNTGATGGFATAANYGKPIPTQTQIVQKPGLPGVAQKALDVGKQVGSVAETVAKAAGGFVEHTAIDVAKQAIGTARTFVDYQTQPIQNKVTGDLITQLSSKQDAVMQAYKKGQMSKDEYTQTLDSLSKAFTTLGQESQKISDGPTPQQRVSDVVNTAINVLTLGSFTAGKALGKEAVGGLTAKLENAVTKVPAVKALVARNTADLVKASANETFDQVLATNAKRVAVGLLIKRPILYQTNISGAKSVYDDIIKGNYGDAAKSSAWLATQMLEGGPLGAFAKGASWMKRGLGKLSYGEGSLIDTISSQIGDKNPAQIARFLSTLEKKAPNEFQEANRVFKILQETNLQAVNNDVQRAAENILTHYQQHNIPLESITPSQLYKDFSNWSKADELAQRTLRSGLVKDINPEDAQKYVVVRWDTPTKEAVAQAVKNAGPEMNDQLAAVKALGEQPGVGWGNNHILMNKIQIEIENAALNKATSAESAAKGIRNISTASTIISDVPKRVSQELAALGYSIAAPFGGRKTPIVAENELRKLVTGAIQGNSEVFDVSSAPNPVLSAIAGAIDKSGLSPQSTNQVANRKLQESLVASIDELGLGGELGFKNTQGGDILNGGKVILSKLQQYVENKKPVLNLGRSAAVTDIRQLRIGEIQEALGPGITSHQAKALSRAIMDAYTKVPLEFRGLGDHIVDNLYKYNPLQKYYSRLQSALRYTYNPFFRVQESVETKLLSHAQVSNLVWNKSKQELDAAAHVLDKAGILTSSLPGEAAQDQVIGRITANITASQKRDLAGLALDLAKSRGITLQEMVNQHPQEVDDAIRVVVQYPRQGILASPLARTLNLAFFPMRYNAKVTMLAAKVIQKQPPSVQLAVIHSLFQMKDWLKSDEGIRWQSEHADAIQVLNWITPINSVEYTFNLLGHKPNSMSDLGQLGGLPLGMITQILDGQGIINLNTPYVNPKTGDVFPSDIPKTTQARAVTALTDLLSTTFTYPGRTLGLPGKNATLKKVVEAFINTNGTQFDKNVDMSRLTPLQQNWVRVLKGDTSQQAIDALYNSPAPGGFQGYTLPPLSLPFEVVPTVKPQPVIQKRTGLPSKPKGKKAKNLAIPIGQ